MGVWVWDGVWGFDFFLLVLVRCLGCCVLVLKRDEVLNFSGRLDNGGFCVGEER